MRTFKTLMINRDISWMYFNKRILDEAANPSIPLLERIKFLGIYSSNLDEFFRVRIAYLRRLTENEIKSKSDKYNSAQILKEILELNETYSLTFDLCFRNIVNELAEKKIYLVNENDLTDYQKKDILKFYHEELMNNLYPLLVTSMTEEPDLNDQRNYLAVKMTKQNNAGKISAKQFALIEIPTSTFSRFHKLPSEDENIYIIFLDDIIRFCLPQIFSSLKFSHYDAYTIKFTRDAEMEYDDSAHISALEKVKKGIRSRKSGLAVRFIYDREIQPDLLNFIRKMLQLTKTDAQASSGRYHNMKDLINFPNPGMQDLQYPVFSDIPKKDFENSDNLIDLIRMNDRFLHFPYHNIDYFIRFLRECAINPDVKEIKITLYRLAKKSKIIQALICAALNGKKVTAMIELYARFDEESNMIWADKMKEAGIKVIFGVEGLKVHSKIVHITIKKGNIACISTGNFHEGNAGLYTDFFLMTANKEIVAEVAMVFDFLKQPYINPQFKHLLVAPLELRKKLIDLIRSETENAKKGKKAFIHCKINHLVDQKIIEKFYQASAAGVEIKLLVRGNCSLIPGVKSLSENIEAYGIIDRFLEHSRIFIFHNNGDDLFFIGSSDLMTRNLDSRIEVITPVFDTGIKLQLRKVMDYGLKDNVKSRIVDGTDKNEIKKDNNKPFSSQNELKIAYQEDYLKYQK
jgi:polyphosphate kinase